VMVPKELRRPDRACSEIEGSRFLTIRLQFGSNLEFVKSLKVCYLCVEL
jgi:hypothetical protein